MKNAGKGYPIGQTGTLMSEKRNHYWTEEEVLFLKENHSKYTVPELHKKYLTNRSKNAISSKLYSLGLSAKPRRVKWTEEEERILLSKYKEFSLVEIAGRFLPNRSYDSIKTHCEVMGISPKKEVREWTSEEDRILNLYYGEMTGQELKDTFGLDRSLSTIKSRASKLDLCGKASKKWTEEEVSFLVSFYHEKTIEELDEVLNRGYGAIRNKAAKLNLSKKKKTYKKWTEEEENFLRRKSNYYSLEQLCSHLQRTRGSIVSKIKRLGLSTRPEHFTRKDLLTLFVSKRDGSPLFRSTNYEEWREKGLGFYWKSKACVTTPKMIRKFLKERPEALDIYALPSQTIRELKIKDIDEWPEPPIYKLIKCSSIGKEDSQFIQHEEIYNRFLLYERYCACSLCGLRLSRWADAYTNDHEEGIEGKISRR